jgi:hypothetical protein
MFGKVGKSFPEYGGERVRVADLHAGCTTVTEFCHLGDLLSPLTVARVLLPVTYAT